VGFARSVAAGLLDAQPPTAWQAAAQATFDRLPPPQASVTPPHHRLGAQATPHRCHQRLGHAPALCRSL